MTKWLHNGVEYNPDYEDIDFAGFVYMVTNLVTKRKYIGKKVFHARRTLPALKDKKRKRKVVKESDWRNYKTSSEHIVSDIKKYGEENFLFEIVSLHSNRSEINYAELKLQVLLDVLEARDSNGERIYYNLNIERRYYPSELYKDERMRVDEIYRAISSGSFEYPNKSKSSE